MTPALNTIHIADCLDFIAQMPDALVHLVVADPPYFRVQLQHEWDNQWPDEAALNQPPLVVQSARENL